MGEWILIALKVIGCLIALFIVIDSWPIPHSFWLSDRLEGWLFKEVKK